MSDALNRGTVEHANCELCPFSRDGRPNQPVVSEYPDDPMWIVIGEGPGFNEMRSGRPFVGASGQVVNRILHRIGRPREHLAILNATLCMPPQGSPVEDRERAAECCKPRMVAELAQWPGKPILTLGAVAARAVIPKEILDAIDPPDVPKSRKRSQKEKQKAARKDERKRGRAIERIAHRRYKAIVKKYVGDLKHEIRRKYQRKPDKAHLEHEVNQHKGRFWSKAWKDANEEYEQKLKEKELARLNPDSNKPQKPKKKKPIKITDIVGTLFDVDVDGSGVRPVIPAIHPAALLRGGGASIGGSHTPDMAFVNIVYDAAKCDSLAKGKDIRLHPIIEIEVSDQAKATELLLSILHEVVDSGSGSLDLETYVDDPDRHHALMAWIAKIRVIGISTHKRAVSVAWDLIPNWLQSYLQLVLGTIPIHYHHGLYDRTVLRAYGFVLPVFGIDELTFEDSLFAHHAAFPGNSHRLQTVTAQFFGVGAWKAEFRNAKEETPDQLAVYNAMDTFSTHANVSALQVWVKRTNTEKVYAIDRTMCDIASRMHLNGMPVNREINAQLISTFTRLSKESKQVVDSKANDPKVKDLIKHHLALQLASKKRKKDSEVFEDRYNIRLEDLRQRDWFWNVNNPKHIAALLQSIGVSLTTMTEGGSISTKKDVLEALADVGIVRDILRYRENDKMLDFVGPIFDRQVGEKFQPGFADADDRIHPIWSIHKISGRWAGSEPFGVSNPPREKPSKPTAHCDIPSDAIILEQIKDGEHAGKWIYASRPTTKRQVVVRKGRKLVGFDFAQIEARILALLSGDDFMCDVFGRDGDIHTECAIDVFLGFVDRSPKERKMMRTVCKTLEYATWYGANDETVWKGLLKEGYNFKLVDVSASLAVLRRKMAGIVRWQRETIQAASRPPHELRGMVIGRRRVWPMGQVDQGEALNIVPQTTGAEIMDLGMAKMDGRIYDRGYRQCFPIVQVHDAAAYECWEDDADKLLVDMNECFAFEWTNPISGKTVKFPIDAAIGDAWYEV